MPGDLFTLSVCTTFFNSSLDISADKISFCASVTFGKFYVLRTIFKKIAYFLMLRWVKILVNCLKTLFYFLSHILNLLGGRFFYFIYIYPVLFNDLYLPRKLFIRLRAGAEKLGCHHLGLVQISTYTNVTKIPLNIREGEVLNKKRIKKFCIFEHSF